MGFSIPLRNVRHESQEEIILMISTNPMGKIMIFISHKGPIVTHGCMM